MKRNITILLMLLLTLCVNAQDEPEPQFLDYYFVNEAGDKIEGSVSVDLKVVYLVLLTENAIGEVVVITMDKDEEYFYKKKFLSAGSTIKFPVEQDIQKVKLTIYNSDIRKHVKRRKRMEGKTKISS